MPSFVRLFLAVFLLQSCTTYEPGALSAELSTETKGRVFFETLDIYDFPDFAASPQTRTIHGDLTVPDGTLRGAVILSHGSGGPGNLHRRWARWLNEQGIATFLLDHFSPRNVGSTIRDQIRITEQGMMADVIAAQRLLATHPAIPADRIGHMGWSKGGSTGVLAAIERFGAFAGQDQPLAFIAAFYPFCGLDMSGEALAAPLLVMIGDQDDWTPPGPCVTAVKALNSPAIPAEVEVYPGAVHGFDSTSQGYEDPSAVTVRDVSAKCLLRTAGDGTTRTLDGKNDVATLSSRIAYLRACGVRGVKYGGNASARAASQARVKAWIDLYFP